MPEEAAVPGIGQVDKKYVYAGVAIVAGIVGYAWWSRNRASSAAASSASQIDPLTGLPYSAETGTGGSNYVNPNPNASGSGTGGTAPVIATDQDWVSAVTTKMTWYEPGYLSSVLGLYIDRQGLSQEQAAVVREAWAQAGHPPGNQQIILAGGGSTPGPNPKAVPPSGLHETATTKGSVSLAWNGPANANSYNVQVTGGMNSTYGPVNTPSMNWMGLKPATSYTFTVTTVLADGTESAKSAPRTVKTPAK